MLGKRVPVPAPQDRLGSGEQNTTGVKPTLPPLCLPGLTVLLSAQGEQLLLESHVQLACWLPIPPASQRICKPQIPLLSIVAGIFVPEKGSLELGLSPSEL